MHDAASHEAHAGAEPAPIVAQPVWIEETLKDAPCSVAEKPNGGHEKQRTTKRLSEDRYERAARPRYASASSSCDLKGKHADDHVEHTFYKEARAGEPLKRAETVHGFMVGRICGSERRARGSAIAGILRSGVEPEQTTDERSPLDTLVEGPR